MYPLTSEPAVAGTSPAGLLERTRWYSESESLTTRKVTPLGMSMPYFSASLPMALAGSCCSSSLKRGSMNASRSTMSRTLSSVLDVSVMNRLSGTSVEAPVSTLQTAGGPACYTLLATG